MHRVGKQIQFDEHGHLERPSIPANIKHLLPTGANVQLVVSLSSSDTLTIYEAGDRLRIDPDTRLLLSRRGHPLTQFAIKDLPDDHEWGIELMAAQAAHLCANGQNLTYLVLQAGNQGGYFVMLTERSDGYHLLPIGAVQQGRLILNVNDPSQITVWSVAPEDAMDCTGCPKRYLVETFQFDGESFKVIEKKKTNRKYESFQDEPLKLSY